MGCISAGSSTALHSIVTYPRDMMAREGKTSAVAGDVEYLRALISAHMDLDGCYYARTIVDYIHRGVGCGTFILGAQLLHGRLGLS
jgi:hypothetical protein